MFSSWRLFREPINYSMGAVPEYIDRSGIKQYLTNLIPVVAIHDLHIWPLMVTEMALTVHVVMDVL